MKYSRTQATVIIGNVNDLNISWKIFQLEVGGSTDLWSQPDSFIFQKTEKEARVSVFLDLILPKVEEVVGRLKMLRTLREGNDITLQFKERSKRLRKLNCRHDHLQGEAECVCEMTKWLSQNHNMNSASFVDVLWQCIVQASRRTCSVTCDTHFIILLKRTELEFRKVYFNEVRWAMLCLGQCYVLKSLKEK